MKYRNFVVIIGFLFSSISAQKYKFPQNLKYPHGFMPATFSTKNLESWYSQYLKANLLQKCNDAIAPRTDNGTKVEAMGWSMIIAAYMGDKETFDGLYKFYKSKIQGHGMMAWLTSCGGVNDAGSASDGDLDVAFSLVIATAQWGDAYKEEATKVIDTVEKLITDCSGTSVIVGGYSGKSPYGGCDKTDISYYTPAFFRAFAEFTGNEAWKKLADDTYIVLNNAANDNTGLVPDWHTWKGGQSSGNYKYAFDACRVPWRMALDYLWNGNEKAKTWCTTISNWANKIGPKNIKDGYNLDGSVTGSWHNMSFVGAFAVAAMCNNQEVADAFGTEVARMSFDSYWYHAFLGNCYMLALSGNMWRPGFDTIPENVNGKRVREKSFLSSLIVKNMANRELVLNGVEKTCSAGILTLAGKRINHTTSVDGNSITLDISSLGKGCYILTIDDNKAQQIDRRIFSIY